MRVVFGIVLVAIAALAAMFLLNLPGWYGSGEIPLIAALLAGETGLAGLILCGYGAYRFLLKDWLDARGAAAALKEYPEEPWRANRQWAAGVVTSSSIGPAGFLWFFAMNWWAVLWFAVTDRAEELMQVSWVEKALMTVFPIIGLITLWAAVKHTTRWWRYGSSTLLIETLPGRPGQVFKGTVKTRIPTKPKRSYRVRLTGHERVWSRDRSDASDIAKERGDVRDNEPFAEIEQRIPPSKMLMTDGAISFPVTLQIPEDVPSNDLAAGMREVVWKIVVENTGKSEPTFNAEFEVPVYRTSSPQKLDEQL